MRNKTPFTAGIAALCAAAVTTMFVPGPATGAAAPSAATGSHSAVKTADRAPGEYTSQVRGSFGKEGTVRGRFAPDRFFTRGGTVYAVGTLTATLRRGSGDVVGTATRTVTLPVRSASTPGQRVTCDILNLVLGPLDLNLLGLEVHLNRVVLDIVAVTGAGNLLGNLLCAVAGLLDGSPLSTLESLQLSNLLNRILNLLG